MNSAAHPLPPTPGAGPEGDVRVRPGRGVAGAVLLRRPALASALSRGLPAGQWPAMMGRIHNLCASAHELCATLALRAAGHAQALPAADLDEQAAVDHVRRIVLDWPRELLAADTVARDAVGAVAMRSLHAGPWLARARSELTAAGRRDAARRWLDDLLGMPCAEWLSAWDQSPQATVRDWSRVHTGWLPTLLRAARQADTPQCVDGATAQCGHENSDGLHALAIDLRDAVSAAQQTHTGCWSRQRDVRRHQRRLGASDMLGARLAELARIATLPVQERWLSHGSHSVGPGRGVAWVETSRGVLVHQVCLDGGGEQAAVLSCDVIAPTDWNFHPDGACAHALARSQGDAATRVLMCAFDPCVPWRLHAAAPAPETAHA